MNRTYKHLSSDGRDRLAVLMSCGRTLRDIGAQLGRSARTLSRELKRNRPRRGRPEYLPHNAQARAAPGQ